jgi:hypothetical protein
MDPEYETLGQLLCNSDREYLKISSQSGGLSYRPKLGRLPAQNFQRHAADTVLSLLSQALVRTGMGRRCSLKLLAEYRCVTLGLEVCGAN